MRRMENDLLFFHELIGNCSVEKDSKIYTISPKFGKGTMQSFEVMPGAEIVYSNVHITTPIQKNIQCIDRFIEVTYCFHGRVNMLFSNQPEMVMSDHYISVFNGASHLKSCDFGEEPFVGVSVVAYLPQIIHFGIQFDPSSCIAIGLLFAINAIQAIGDFTATTTGGMDREPTDKELKGAYLTGERPLFHGKKLHIEQTIFNDGESPLKESRDIYWRKLRLNWNIPSGTPKK